MSLHLSHAQRERLAYLELRAFFVGELRRADLEARFSIKPAAATRDLNAYRALAPDNLVYDRGVRAYLPSEQFQAVFGFAADRVLSWLLNGFGDGQALKLGRSIPCEGPGALVQPDFGILAVLTRAIHGSHAVQVSYLSLSSGQSHREIVPVALADNGSRWHVRAYDRSRARFSDFVLTRIAKAKMLPEEAAEHERLTSDAQWSRIVDLELVPHPGLKHPEAVAADYAMRDGMLALKVRAALAGYALLRWGVDCSVDHRLDAARHHLWLRNPQTLYGVESAVLAPGYGDPDEQVMQP